MKRFKFAALSNLTSTKGFHVKRKGRSKTQAPCQGSKRVDHDTSSKWEDTAMKARLERMFLRNSREPYDDIVGVRLEKKT
ncbi:hypothetical protein [Caballeronia temeraria]|uniref:hypothetical protein n=1 Tax=Caballeronia temeraria TaxID=1777137 RepID=UPI000AD97F26|nr:hypothetical protein [Caballeronia temeraria]